MPETPQFISAETMRRLLRNVYASDHEGGLMARIARGLRDPAIPLGSGGRSRPHPLWLALFVISLVAAASFALFTMLER